MIKVFAPSDRDFSSNGDAVIQPLRAKVHKEDNGDYYLDLMTGLEYAKYMEEGNIIVANTPQGHQPFRVSNVQKTNNKITTKAWHIFYDAEDYVIADSYVVDKNCEDALSHLNRATSPESPFVVWSDVTTVDSFRCVRQSLYSAINVVRERWGGHLVRDGFTIGLKDTIGQDNGITVEYKKNLREISAEEDWTDVVTQLLPVGKDGILLNEINPSEDIFVYSSLQYNIPYAKSLSFSQDINREDFTSDYEYKKALVANLKRQAQDYVNVNCLPKVNYTLKANLERVTDIGDTIEVKDNRLGVSMLTSVIAFDYDCILGKYTEIEFGNFRPKLSNLLTTVTVSASSIASETATAKVDASLQDVWSVIGDLESQIGDFGNYDTLENRPMIEGVTLEGDKTFDELNLVGITNSEIESIIV